MMELLGKALYFVPLLVGYFVVDRCLSYYFTGSWWKQPSDVESEEAES